MGTLETIKSIVSSGSEALLAAVLLGLFRLARDHAPALLKAFVDWRTEASALRADVAALRRDMANVSTKQTEIAVAAAEQKGVETGITLATGAHQAISVERESLPPPERKNRS